MNRRLIIDIKDARVSARQDGTVDSAQVVVEGDFAFGVENLQRFVDVKLLDASGVSRNQQDMTWTYEDTQTEPLRVGDYVLVPFGWRNGEFLAKVVKTSDEPTYTGIVPIKKVAARMVAEF